MTGPRSAGNRRPMTLWRLEWIRLVRTRRLVGLMAVYVFLGLMAPPLARYLPDIISSSATGDMTIVAPPARPVDGVSGYASNAAQIRSRNWWNQASAVFLRSSEFKSRPPDRHRAGARLRPGQAPR